MKSKLLNNYNHYSAPGRVCLYGEHQDYLKLKVIPAAVNLRTSIKVKQRTDNKISVHSIDLNQAEDFTLNPTIQYTKSIFDYLKAVLNVLTSQGYYDYLKGLDVIIKSDVPIGSGLSSSAALLVSWLNALNNEFLLKLNPLEIANIAYIAEHDQLGINCGIMDQYSSSLGGIFSLDCDGPPYNIKQYSLDFRGIVIGDSKIRRAANEPLTMLKKQLFSGLAKISNESFKILKTLSLKTLDEHSSLLTENEYNRLKGTIIIRDITTKASQILSSKNSLNKLLLGELLTKQHHALKEYLEVSIPELDKLVDGAINAGALGAKLTGAGFGGCIIAYAPGKEREVAKAINQLGGKSTICQVDIFGGRKD